MTIQERQQVAQMQRDLEELKARVAALEAKPKPASRPTKEKKDDLLQDP